MEQQIEIRTYGVNELAQKYFPLTGMQRKDTATRKLYKLITLEEESHSGLYKELREAGWRKGRHIFTPKQVRIIFKHLDYPHTVKYD